MEVHVREESLPGVGRRYHIPLDRDRSLTVVVLHDGRREVGVISASNEGPDVAVLLTNEQATAVAALLTGASIAIARTGPPDRRRRRNAPSLGVAGHPSPRLADFNVDWELPHAEAASR